jgi:hypothetical protein
MMTMRSARCRASLFLEIAGLGLNPFNFLPEYEGLRMKHQVGAQEKN